MSGADVRLVVWFFVSNAVKLLLWVGGTALGIWLLVLLMQALGWQGNGSDVGCDPSPTGCF